ncbi:MAG: type II toxin-antitoxin system RelB/DinJ family antitoxin [Acidobacteriota bacterium]|nr:type II toxin-antitoxin system RelB/DinJ family antitoxin [Acidobacteriota bacterium]
MANNTSNVSFRIDTEVKNEADRLFSELGMNMTTAFNIFLRQVIREEGIPFALNASRPNKETVAAMMEAERIARDPNTRRFHSVEELFEELDN